MSPDPDRHPWRPWRSKVVWASVIAFVALRRFGVQSSGDRSSAFRDRIRLFNRRWFNPLVLHFAGSSPWPVARLEHRGRRSRKPRATPLLAQPLQGGFLILMPYGTEVDWVRNLRHAGEGVLQYQGVRYRVGHPRIEKVADGLPDLPFPIGRLIALAGIRHVTRVDVLASLGADVSLPA